MSVYKVAFCPLISRITLIFFRAISVIRGQIFFLFDFVDRHYLKQILFRLLLPKIETTLEK